MTKWSWLKSLYLKQNAFLSWFILATPFIFPQKNITKADTVIFQFLWRNKNHYIKRSQLVKEYDKGGIKAPEFESMVSTFRVNWLKSCLSQPNSMWLHIPRSLFKKIGCLDFYFEMWFWCEQDPYKAFINRFFVFEKWYLPTIFLLIIQLYGTTE